MAGTKRITNGQAEYRSLGAMIAAGAAGGAVSGVANAAAQQGFAKLGSIRKPKNEPKK